MCKMKILLFILVLHFKATIQNIDYNMGNDDSKVDTKLWIDPHDMNTDVNFNLHRQTHNKISSHEKLDAKCTCEKSEDVTLIYLKRFVSLILNSALKNEPNSLRAFGKYVVEVESTDYQYLLQFVNRNNVGVEELRKLDTILSNMYSNSMSDQLLDSVLSFGDKFQFFFNINTLLLVCIGYFVYLLLKSNLSLWNIILYGIILIIIYDYPLRYKMHLEEIEKHNMEIKLTSKCDSTRMSWTQWFKYMVDTENCKEKKTINPLDVLLLQVKHIIVIPLSAVGTGMGGFGKELWSGLGYPWNILIFPVMLVFVLLIVAITLTSMNNSSFKIKLFHLLHFEFGSQSQQPSHVKVDIHLPVERRPEEESQLKRIAAVCEEKSANVESQKPCMIKDGYPVEANIDTNTENNILPTNNSQHAITSDSSNNKDLGDKTVEEKIVYNGGAGNSSSVSSSQSDKVYGIVNTNNNERVTSDTNTENNILSTNNSQHAIKTKSSDNEENSTNVEIKTVKEINGGGGGSSSSVSSTQSDNSYEIVNANNNDDVTVTDTNNDNSQLTTVIPSSDNKNPTNVEDNIVEEELGDCGGSR